MFGKMKNKGAILFVIVVIIILVLLLYRCKHNNISKFEVLINNDINYPNEQINNEYVHTTGKTSVDCGGTCSTSEGNLYKDHKYVIPDDDQKKYRCVKINDINVTVSNLENVISETVDPATLSMSNCSGTPNYDMYKQIDLKYIKIEAKFEIYTVLTLKKVTISDRQGNVYYPKKILSNAKKIETTGLNTLTPTDDLKAESSTTTVSFTGVNDGSVSKRQYVIFDFEENKTVSTLNISTDMNNFENDYIVMGIKDIGNSFDTGKGFEVVFIKQ